MIYLRACPKCHGAVALLDVIEGPEGGVAQELSCLMCGRVAHMPLPTPVRAISREWEPDQRVAVAKDNRMQGIYDRRKEIVRMAEVTGSITETAIAFGILPCSVRRAIKKEEASATPATRPPAPPRRAE